MSTPSDPADPLVGRVLAGRYRLESLLGVGAMGAVYRARITNAAAAVAVKVLHPARASDPHLAQRFEREAFAGAKLDHPNCVRVLDTGRTEDGLRFLVMPLLEGSELRGVMDAGPIPLPRVVELVLDILRGLDHAHRLGLVHRDVKPENVFVVRETDGTSVRSLAKLVDFGLVKLLEARGEPGLTRAGMVFGTPWYMSPEQASGGIVDARADLYAVGAVMHEMLSGKPPFDADETAIVLRMHMLADPPALPASVPAPIARFVLGLMAKQAKDRPASAAQAARALQAAVAASRTPTVARPMPTPARPSSRPRPRPLPVVVATPPVSLLTASRNQGRLFGFAGVLAAAAMVAVFFGLSSGSASTPDTTGPTAVAEALSHEPATETETAEPSSAAPVETPDAAAPADTEAEPAPPSETVALADASPPKTTTPQPREEPSRSAPPAAPERSEGRTDRPASKPDRPAPEPSARPRSTPAQPRQRPAPEPAETERVIHLRPRSQPRTQPTSKLPGAGGSSPGSDPSERTHLQPRRPARDVASS